MKFGRSKEQIPKQGGGGNGNGHKSNWLTILKAYLKTLDDLTKAAGAGDLAAILADTNEVQVSLADGGFTDLLIDAIKAETALIVADTNEVQVSLADGGFTDLLIDAIKAETALIVADTSEVQVSLANGGFTDLLIDAITTHLTDIKGATWSDETLEAIKAAIDAIGVLATSQVYIEQIPDTDITLAAIDNAITVDPPTADAENSVVDIDYVANYTHVLRSLWVNITSLGTGGTKLTFDLWVYLGGAATKVDSVEVAETGIQNLMDIFGLQEVHADGIWITVITDGGTADAALTGVYRCAKARKAA